MQLLFPFELSDGIVRVDYALSESWRVLLLSAPRGVRPDVFAFLEKNRVEGIKYVILLDEEVDTSRPGDVLWIASSDCDPSRDVTIRDGVVLVRLSVESGRRERVFAAVAQCGRLIARNDRACRRSLERIWPWEVHAIPIAALQQAAVRRRSCGTCRWAASWKNDRGYPCGERRFLSESETESVGLN